MRKMRNHITSTDRSELRPNDGYGSLAVWLAAIWAAGLLLGVIALQAADGLEEGAWRTVLGCLATIGRGLSSFCIIIFLPATYVHLKALHTLRRIRNYGIESLDHNTIISTNQSKKKKL